MMLRMRVEGSPVMANAPRGDEALDMLVDDFDAVTVDLPGMDDEPEIECQFCQRQIFDNGGGEWLATLMKTAWCPGAPAHWPKNRPLDWANWASLKIDEEEDSITMYVSIGDPRGAFSFTVRRVDDRVILHLPHPGESTPHARTKEIADGTLEVL